MKKYKSLLLVGALLAMPFLAEMAKAAPTVLAAQKILRSGVTPTAAVYSGTGVGLADVTNGNKIYMLTDGVFLRLNNPAAATDMTITVQDQLVNAQGYSTNVVSLVPRATTIYLGPFKKSRWADGSGYLQCTYVGATTTAIEVMRLPIGELESQTK